MFQFVLDLVGLHGDDPGGAQLALAVAPQPDDGEVLITVGVSQRQGARPNYNPLFPSPPLTVVINHALGREESILAKNNMEDEVKRGGVRGQFIRDKGGAVRGR